MMKRMLAVTLLCLTSVMNGLMAQETFAQQEASAEALTWYEKGEWKQGFKVDAFEQIDVQTFYEQYMKAPQMWDSIFSWLEGWSSEKPTWMRTSFCTCPVCP